MEMGQKLSQLVMTKKSIFMTAQPKCSFKSYWVESEDVFTCSMYFEWFKCQENILISNKLNIIHIEICILPFVSLNEINDF